METVKEKSTKETFKLPEGRTVKIVPVRRQNEWLPKGKANEFLFGDNYIEIQVPFREVGGSLVEPLTTEEREYFEDKYQSGLDFVVGDLSIHKSTDNYWKNFRIKLKDEERILDLSDPMDYLRWAVLKVSQRVAPSWEKRFSRAEYKFALLEEGAREEAAVEEADNLTDAYMILGKMDKSTSKMTNFLNVYYSTKPGSKRVPSDATREWLKTQIHGLIKTNLREFLDTAKDSDYDTRVFIQEALLAGAINRNGGAYVLPEGGIIGTSVSDMIAYVKNDLNNEEVLKITARLEASKGK